MARAIDADELEMFPYSEGAGTEEQILEWIEQTGLSEDDIASRARDLCWKVIDGFINVVKTQPTLTPPNEGAKDKNVPANEPLTLDELGEMSYTDWVWLEFPREKPSDNCWERGWKAYRLYSHERYGVSWIAYRRPPEGEGEENDVIEITENL